MEDKYDLDNNKLYPIKYNGRDMKEEDCDSIFTAFYYSRYSLNDECGIYMGQGTWIYPDGRMEEW